MNVTEEGSNLYQQWLPVWESYEREAKRISEGNRQGFIWSSSYNFSTEIVRSISEQTRHWQEYRVGEVKHEGVRILPLHHCPEKTVLLAQVEPQATTRPHAHLGSSEIVYPIEGELHVRIRGADWTFTPQEFLHIPGGEEHPITAVTRALLLSVFRPGFDPKHVVFLGA